MNKVSKYAKRKIKKRRDGVPKILKSPELFSRYRKNIISRGEGAIMCPPQRCRKRNSNISFEMTANMVPSQKEMEK